MKRHLRLWLGGLLLLGIGILVSTPLVRWRIIGLARGEAFYRGRPTSYWQHEIKTWTEFLRQCGPLRVTCGIGLHPVPPPPTFSEKLHGFLASTFTAEWTPAQLEEPAAIPVLTELLRDSDAEVREYAVTCLFRMNAPGNELEPAILELTRLLMDESAEVRRVTLVALVQINREPDYALPLLRRMLHDPAALVRTRAANALGEWGEAARPALREALEDEDQEVRQAAQDALQRIGSEPKSP